MPDQTELHHMTLRDTDAVDLGQFGRAVWRRKYLVTLCALFFAAAAYFLTDLQDRQYTSTVTVILEAREQQVISNQDQVVADLTLSNPIIESELALLRSPSLVGEVIQRIGIDRFDVIDPALAPPSLIDQAIGLLGRNNREDSASPVQNELVSPEVVRLNRMIETVRRGIGVRRVSESYLIDINVTTTDPLLTADTANVLAAVYIETQLAERRKLAEEATSWLSGQVEAFRDDLAKAEAAVVDYKREQLDRSGSTEEVLQQQLLQLNDQIAAVRSERTAQQARLQRIEAVKAERGAAAAAEALVSEFLSALRAERATLAREDVRLRSSLGPNHPDRLLLSDQIDQIDEAIAAEVNIVEDVHRNEIEILTSQEVSLQSKMNTLETRLADMSAASVRLRELEREAESRRSGFEELLGRLGETRAQVELQRAEAKLVNEAQIPLAPSKPRVKLMTAMGGTVGLTIGLIGALVASFVGAGFALSDRLEEETGLPVLSTIPYIRLRRPLAVLKQIDAANSSLFSEKIRQLRISMTQDEASKGPLSIAVMSSIQNEGKTSTALALTKSFANAGRKAIYVDLDARRPLKYAGVARGDKSDLGQWLRGEVALDDTIIDVEGESIQMIGIKPGQSELSEMLNDLTLSELIEDLGQRFDAIVFDSPPLLAVSDGLAIGKAVNKLVFVVRSQKTSKRVLKYALRGLQHVNLRPFGLVMTMAAADSDPDVFGAGYDY